ncbi:NfeD family protein [bacterium]|nr:NfeD family protein [bacterium]
MEWWGWAIAGFILLAFEMVVPADFFLFFLGVSALVVSALTGLELFSQPWMSWLTFAVLALGFLTVVRQRLVKRVAVTKSFTDMDEVVGGKAIASADLPPQARGKVDMRGSSWSAYNTDSEVIAAGSECIVEAVEGLELRVRRLTRESGSEE